MLRLALPIIVAVIVFLSIHYVFFTKEITLQEAVSSTVIFTLLWLLIYKFVLPGKQVSKN